MEKNYLKLINSLILLILVAFISCNNNDSDDSTEIIVKDFYTEIEENPANNELLGVISANSSQGNLSFELKTEAPAGALRLSSQGGELFVKNSLLFDFEVNPIITASVTILNNQTDIEKTVNIEISVVDVQEITDSIPFVTAWSVPEDDLTIEIPVNSNYDYNYYVDWGDDSFTTNITTEVSHTYLIPGTYTVSIFGKFPAIYFGSSHEDSSKIISINQWGDIEWKSMKEAFRNCDELTYNAVDIPNLKEVTDMSSMFQRAIKFNGMIGDWDVSSVVDMSGIFGSALAFNQPINTWDVGSVTSMVGMFSDARSFNQNINDWDVSEVSTMVGMFNGASNFNQPLNDWDVSNVWNMYGMFLHASSFNQPLDNWDVSLVQNMSLMFSGALEFNQSLGNWQLSSLIYNTSANGMISMLDGSGLSIDSYESTLKGWSESANTPCCIQLGAQSMVYCSSGENYRNVLVAKNWIFVDDKKGSDEECL